MNLEVQERYLSIIEGAGTPFPYVPRHFNHWTQVIDARLCISPKVWALRSQIHSRILFRQKAFKTASIWACAASGERASSQSSARLRLSPVNNNNSTSFVISAVKPCSQQTNWTELSCSTSTAALQPINFVTLTRVTNNASCNWVNFVQVSLVRLLWTRL